MHRRTRYSILLSLACAFWVAGRCATPVAEEPSAPTPTSPGTSPTEPTATPVVLTKLTTAVTTAGALQWPWYVAVQKGFFQDAGLDVDIIVAGTNVRVIQGLLSGSLDVGSGSPDPLIKAVAETGSDLLITGAVMNRPVYSLIVQPEINSYEDLRGKRVGVSAILSMDGLWMRQMLAANGLNFGQDYEMVAIGGTADRYRALVAKGIEAGLLVQPQDFTAVREGFKVLGLSTDVVDGIVWSSYSVTGEFARANEETLVRFLGAMCRSAKWLYDPANRDSAIQILMFNTGSTEEDATQTYELWIGQESLSPDASTDAASVQAMIDALKANEQLPQPIEVDQVLDLTYLEKAKALGYCG